MSPRLSLFVPMVALIALAAPVHSIHADPNCTGLAEIMGNDMVISEGQSDGELSFFVLGPTLYSVWNESATIPIPHTGGDYKTVWNAGTLMHELGHNLGLSHDGPVTDASGAEVLYVTSDNGHLYKLDAKNGTALASVDTRRGSCPDDQVTATPAVQLYGESNPVFQSAMLAERGHPDDLIYVVTHHGCGDDSGNEVIAYYGSDLATRWTFNTSGTYAMDYATDGCEVDYATNTIYCGTHQTTPTQSTVWALDAIPTGPTGSVKWTANAGSIANRPMLASGRVYVVASGSIQCFDGSGGSNLWTLPTGSVVRNLTVEIRDPLPPRFYYTTSDGLLHGTIDNFPNPVPLWPPVAPPDGGKFTTMPAVELGTGKLYLGRGDGSIQQVSADTGALGPSVQAGNPGTLWDPRIDYSGLQPVLNETTTEGSIHRYCLASNTTAVGPASTAGVLALAQNAPNPFSTNTRIGYRLAGPARVEIDIFAIDGRIVRRLVRENEPTGSHDAAWDGRDDGGRSVAAGPYFYRMRVIGADGRMLESSRKIQLVR